jgi:hypothetical protein
MSSRLFYNEFPKPRWIRQGGHIKDPDANLYSFAHANQNEQLVFGVDTTTPEGREWFKKEWESFADMAPEIIPRCDIVFPH